MPAEPTRERLASDQQGLASRPLISVVMPTYNASPVWLQQAIDSVRTQTYTNWELCIADDASTHPEVQALLTRTAAGDARVKLALRPVNGGISAASNTALGLAAGEWVALMDHDDLLSQDALLQVVRCIQDHPDARLFYSDEDKIGPDGARCDPHFKPDWNPGLFLSYNMVGHLAVYAADLIGEVGGFRQGLEGAQDWDLALRCVERLEPEQIRHIPRVLYHWRVHSESTAGSITAKPYAAVAGERALAEHFHRTGVQAQAAFDGYAYRIDYATPEPPPLVSIIIPTRNAHGLVRVCLSSILERTDYPNFEVLLIDNGSDDPAALAYFAELATSAPRVRVLRDPRPFNFSALNNAAVAQARGEFVALVNNDIEAVAPNWLTEMVSIAAQPGVGAVGARLWYPDGVLQHAGVILSPRFVGMHAHKRLPRGPRGYMQRAAVMQDFSAVTAACLVVRKATYQQVGGLDEENLAVAFNDVDFCLRLREAGLRNVFTPRAQLVHHESATRGPDTHPDRVARFERERAYMQHRWAAWLAADPAYNPNLTLDSEDVGLAWPPRGR